MELKEILPHFYLIIQFLACVAAIYFWKNYKNTNLWIFLPFLIYSFIHELISFLFVEVFRYNPRPLVNVYIVISFLVYIYWFDKILNLRYWKWIIGLIYLVTFLYDLFDHGFSNQLFKTGLLIQAIMILSFSVIYFIRLLNDNKVVYYQKIPEFWIILGLLTFYIAFTPLFLVTGKGYNIVIAYYTAINILNFILYTCYILGFYATSRK